MSACISPRGEYSSHEPDSDYVCTFCGVLDEVALIAELNRYRQHSITLNTVAYRISRALIGGEPQESYTGSPVADVEALIADRARLAARVAELEQQPPFLPGGPVFGPFTVMGQPGEHWLPIPFNTPEDTP